MEYDQAHLLAVLADQRNRALNDLAEAKALAMTLSAKLAELEKRPETKRGKRAEAA